jgi:exosortase/archaeosortase family protein
MKSLHKKMMDTFYSIPNSVRKFLVMAITIAISWKFVYILFLMNPRLLDGPLTDHVGNSSAFILNRFSGMQYFSALKTVDTTILEGQIQLSHVSKILHNNRKVLHIADGCNGLELMVLYVGFIFCFPSSKSRRSYFILFGLLLIDGLNILRCSFLGFIKEYYHPYFNISHHFIFKAIVYSVIVFLWIQFTKTSALHEATKYK